MALLRQESDHRLLNGAQMIVSLLSLQGRASKNAEVVLQLSAAASRCHDLSHPPASPCFQWRANHCDQAIS
jgi:two-component sensor histidine kinase